MVARLVARYPSTAACAGVTTWADAHCALAAVPLRPSDRPFASHLDTHVVFDGRLDDRAALRGALDDAARHRSIAPPSNASDARLLLHAWQTWGIGCLERLHGDFAWCLWDATRRILVAARDRYGVKPLYLARADGATLLAGSLAALRRVHGMSSRLSDDGICDFLLFGQPLDNAATCFADIARVPPAHVLTVEEDGRHRTVPYWRLVAPPPLRHPDGRDHVPQFRDTLRQAVRDRVTEPSVAVLMSGGLDSSSVAALAADVVPRQRCVAVTAVYERAFADEERTWSRVAAAHIGITNTHLPVDAYALFSGWEEDFGPEEPTTEPLTAIMRDLLRAAARHSTVVLGGEGGDPVLLPGAVSRLVGRVPLHHLAYDMGSSWRRGLWPPLGLKSPLLRRLGRRVPPNPGWLSARLVRACDPTARWATYHGRHVPGSEPRAEALSALRHPIWPALFESRDPAVTGVPVELRYPFFDHRVVSLALAIPSYPWCLDKSIVRDAMAGHLPGAIRRRPKTPLGGNPIDLRQWPAERLLTEVATADGLQDFVDVAAFRHAIAGGPSWSSRPGILEVACLAKWMTLQARPVSVA
jgi:asparagine synthase (glutamine-hydrolysing)